MGPLYCDATVRKHSSQHDRVEELLGELQTGDATGVLANATEVFYLVGRFEDIDADDPTMESLRTGNRDVRALTRQGVSIRKYL